MKLHKLLRRTAEFVIPVLLTTNFSAIFLFLSLELFAQDTFHKRFGTWSDDSFVSLLQTDDGFVVAGSSWQIGSALLKFNLNGDTMWTTQIQIGNLRAIETDKNGNFILVHAHPLSPSDTGNAMSTDLVKLNSEGKVLWSKKINGLTVHKIVKASDDNFILAGVDTASGWSSKGTQCIVIAKMNDDGDMLWTNKFTLGDSLIWYNSDNILGLTIAPDSGYFLRFFDGYFHRLIKLDANGNLEWGKMTEQFQINFITVHDQELLIVGAIRDTGYIKTSSVMVRMDNAGNVKWGKVYIDNTFDGTNCIYVIPTSDKGYALIGYLSRWRFFPSTNNRDIFLLRTDNSGKVQWAKAYGGDVLAEVGYKGFETPDKNFIIGGDIGWDIFTEYPDYYLVKTDSAGNSYCLEKSITITDSSFIPLFTTNNTYNKIDQITTIYESSYHEYSGMHIQQLCSTGKNGDNPVNRNNVRVYPNPAHNQINVILPYSKHQTSNLKLFLRDITGRTLLTQQITAETTTLDISSFAKGVYLISIESPDSVSFAPQKIIIN